MKTIAIGDLHGRSSWKHIVNTQSFDKLIFMGDYFDSFDIPGKEQINNFLDLIEYKKNNPDNVVLLIGNHDHHYFPEIGDTATSGYQPILAPLIGNLLDSSRKHLQMAYRQGELLFTHAGVTATWLDECLGAGAWDPEGIEQHVNEIWKYQPLKFIFKTYRMSDSPYGDNIWQSPIWIRPRSLMADAVDFKKKYIQIVGHTPQKRIDIKGQATGGRYYFIDTLGSSGEYLIIEDGQFSTAII